MRREIEQIASEPEVDPNKWPDCRPRAMKSSHNIAPSNTLDGTIVGRNNSAKRTVGNAAANTIYQSIRLIIPSERYADANYIIDRPKRGEIFDYSSQYGETGWASG